MKPLPCLRPTLSGKPCRNPAAWGAFGFSEWLNDLSSCGRHLTPAERARREQDEADSQAAAVALAERDPVCWSWPVPDDPFADPEADEIFRRMGLTREKDNHWTALANWQDRRCGICASRDGRQVLDHDHFTGLSRGWLCLSCNSREGHADGPTDVYARWRALPAAVVLGVTFEYVGMDTSIADPAIASDYRHLPPWAPVDRTGATEARMNASASVSRGTVTG